MDNEFFEQYFRMACKKLRYCVHLFFKKNDRVREQRALFKTRV